MNNLTDAKILKQTYQKFFESGKVQKVKKLSQSREISYRTQVLSQIEKWSFYLKSKSSTMSEKEKIIGKCKKFFQDYLAQIKANPEINAPKVQNKINELVNLVVEFENEKMLQIRNKQIAGERIDLEDMLAQDKNISVFLKMPIETFIGNHLGTTNYTVIGNEDSPMYMTEKGAKYHRQDCPYCKGKELLPVTPGKAKNLGLTPCRCIEEMGKIVFENLEENETEESEKQETKTPADTHQYITAFVDESVRTNPWKELDKSLPYNQGVYSYIVCAGFLTEETQIIKKNYLFANVGAIHGIDTPRDVTVKAITEILVKLIMEGYDKNVVIYTDNMEAMSTWHKAQENAKLSKFFTSIRVCYIPREENTKADNLGRNKALAEVPFDLMKTVLLKSKAYDKIKEAFASVEDVFDEK